MTLVHNISRQSNMELLRVISMIFIMVIHAQFYCIPYSIPRWFIVIGADAGVNCFVLISGYFGIHPKIKSFSSFIFQILFFIFIGNMILFGEGKSASISYNIVSFSWFIRAYIALYVFAPILNAYAEKATQKQFMWFLILWAVVEFVMGYTIDYLKFQRGYSFQAFILLYMTARYIRIHGGRFFSFAKCYDMLLFMAFTLASAICMSFSESIGKLNGGEYYFRAYNSPLMIIASVYFMLFFSKLEIKHKAINWAGKSAYAAFLFHCVVYEWYRNTCLEFYLHNHYIVASLYSLIFILAIFTFALLIDQIRLVIWEGGIKFMNPVFGKINSRFHNCSE